MLWLLTAVGCECRREGVSRIEVSIPASLRDKLNCAESLTLNFEAGEAEVVTTDTAIVGKLVTELKAEQSIGRAVPECQPESVRDVSQRLFEQYSIENGSVHLSGCTLEDRAILRVTYVARESDAAVEGVDKRFLFKP